MSERKIHYGCGGTFPGTDILGHLVEAHCPEGWEPEYFVCGPLAYRLPALHARAEAMGYPLVACPRRPVCPDPEHVYLVTKALAGPGARMSTTPLPGVIVTLTLPELLYAILVAIIRWTLATLANRKRSFGDNALPHWTDDIEGTIGECVLAKYTGKPWRPSITRDKTVGDVDGRQVKTTVWLDGCLVVKKGDPPTDKCRTDQTYVLITWVPGNRYQRRIVGWQRGSYAKLEANGFWRTRGVTDPAYFVPQDKLKPMPPPEHITDPSVASSLRTDGAQQGSQTLPLAAAPPRAT